MYNYINVCIRLVIGKGGYKVTKLYITLTDFILVELKTDMSYKLLDLYNLVQMSINCSMIQNCVSCHFTMNQNSSLNLKV